MARQQQSNGGEGGGGGGGRGGGGGGGGGGMYPWVLLAATFLIYLITIGSIKSYGILATELMQFYKASASTTSAVGSTCAFMQSLLGPIANSLCLRFTFRGTMFFGGVLIGVGFFLSSFVQSVEMMFLTHSVIAGIGYSFTYVPCITVLNLTFEKRRGLANGIMLSASGIGGFMLPYIYTYLFEMFDVRGGLMIMSAIMLQVCIGATIIRQPVNLTKQESTPDNISDTKELVESDHNDDKNSREVDEYGKLCTRTSESTLNYAKKEKNFLSSNLLATVANSTSFSFSSSHDKFHISPLRGSNKIINHHDGALFKDKDTVSTMSLFIFNKPQYGHLHTRRTSSMPADIELIHRPSTKCNIEQDQQSAEKTSQNTKFVTVIKFILNSFTLDFRLLKNKSFILYALAFMLTATAYACNFYMLPPYIEVIGYSKNDGAFAMFVVGICELFARILVGWFLDLNLLSSRLVFVLFMGVSGVTQTCVPLMTSMTSLSIYAAVVGILPGTLYTLMPLMLVEAVGIERLPSGVCLVVVINALFSVAVLPLIGLFKDISGTWTISWIVSGTFMCIATLLILIEMYCVRPKIDKMQTEELDDPEESTN